MEQLALLKRTLNLPTIYETYSPIYGKVGGFEIVSLSLLISLVLRLITSHIAPVYIINGLLVPLFFQRHNAPLEHYWPCFACLLLIRQIISTFGLIDVTFSLLSPSC